MRVRDQIGEMANLPWAVAYSGAERLRPEPARTIIKSVTLKEEGIYITAEEGERTYSALAIPKHTSMQQELLAVLQGAQGKSLAEAENLDL